MAYAVRTPGCTHPGLGSSAFDRLYLRNRFYFLFLRLLRCFSSPGSLRTPMDSVHGDGIAPAGFPHSEICGSRNMCFSPQLFAAYHVFLRLSVPGHSPRALSCLTSPTFPSPLPSCTLCCSYSRNEVSDVVLPDILLAYKISVHLFPILLGFLSVTIMYLYTTLTEERCLLSFSIRFSRYQHLR